MPPRKIRQCLQCGLETPVGFSEFRERHISIPCEKCDEDLLSQSDGSIMTHDIAHHHETVHQANLKMMEVLQRVWEGYARGVRLIVGGGRIRDEILSQCEYFLDQGYIKSFSVEGSNHGAIVVCLR